MAAMVLGAKYWAFICLKDKVLLKHVLYCLLANRSFSQKMIHFSWNQPYGSHWLDLQPSGHVWSSMPSTKACLSQSKKSACKWQWQQP